MSNVLVLLALPESFREYYKIELGREFPDVNFIHVDHVSKTEPHLAEADVLVTFGPHLRERAEHVFRSAVNLKWVQAMGTGVDNIAEIATLKKDVLLTNIHGIHGKPMSEAAIAAMLALTRELPRLVLNKERHRWERFPPTLLDGRVAGILGIGAIAEVLSPRLQMLGMKVIGFSSAPRELPGFDEMRASDNLPAVVGDLDHLIILTPHSARTHHMVNAAVFAALKPGCFIVNLARGGVVDEQALMQALNADKLGGAALDVFETEPLPEDHPLWTTKNVILSPHLGGFSHDSSKHTLPALTHNLRCFLAGDHEKMVNRVAR